MINLRGRAWKRAKTAVKVERLKSDKGNQKQFEKCWKLLYTRADKLHRAKQLGIDYPKRTLRQVLDSEEVIDENL